MELLKASPAFSGAPEKVGASSLDFSPCYSRKAALEMVGLIQIDVTINRQDKTRQDTISSLLKQQVDLAPLLDHNS